MRIEAIRAISRRRAGGLFVACVVSCALLCASGAAHPQGCEATEATVANGVLSDADVPPVKRTNARYYLTAATAYPLLAAQPDRVLFIDVRTRGEVVFGGMATVADANIPFLFLPENTAWDPEKNAFRTTPNPDFVAEVGRRLAAKGLTRDDPVVLICQGGTRSAKAVDALTAAGYTLVFSIVDGFEGDIATDGPTKGQRTVNGWKNAGLPWSYTLARDKMYVPN